MIELCVYVFFLFSRPRFDEGLYVICTVFFEIFHGIDYSLTLLFVPTYNKSMNTTTLLVLLLLLSDDKNANLKNILPLLSSLSSLSEGKEEQKSEQKTEKKPEQAEKKETDDTEVSVWLKKIMQVSPE